ncbi:very-short-patch-repair endonuclease [Rhizomicrobium palustre]|jgi:very-short-patch-repair endonuclease|uniref:Very-short-patch-repair endonuclease n=2 Tax=Rhizomicrobium palustre TaxID=189966 RepID=A0A846MY88_9PROT|nr:very-short-patch-repair endonuclease [Rhizomicrobium palustre]
MRHDPTDAEKKFWFAVRGRKFGGHKFKRQYPIGPYIADFVCIEQKLIVELDGGQHGLAEHEEYDAERTAYLKASGFVVLRYWNDEFLRMPEVVLDEVFRTLTAPSPEMLRISTSPPKGAR